MYRPSAVLHPTYREDSLRRDRPYKPLVLPSYSLCVSGQITALSEPLCLLSKMDIMFDILLFQAGWVVTTELWGEESIFLLLP